MKKLILFFVAAFVADPALADDWTLNCTYSNSLKTKLHYDAGGPSYTIEILRGIEGLPKSKSAGAAYILSQSDVVLFANRQETSSDARNILIRVSRATMRTALEAGDGVSWDHLATTGTCKAL